MDRSRKTLFLGDDDICLCYPGTETKRPFFRSWDGEITDWYTVLASGDERILQLAGSMYGRITYFYNSTYMWTHPSMLFIAYASLIVTAFACIARIYVRKRKMWKTTAWLGIICFASLIFTYLLTYIVPGIHSVVQP
ncbi:MAG: hypothetical protein J5U19_15995 [Candidatus Methanoperedens sp.]|nr:hypothetical protein [Candidatus Methanoperedens sp.]